MMATRLQQIPRRRICGFLHLLPLRFHGVLLIYVPLPNKGLSEGHESASLEELFVIHNV